MIKKKKKTSQQNKKVDYHFVKLDVFWGAKWLGHLEFVLSPGLWLDTD